VTTYILTLNAAASLKRLVEEEKRRWDDIKARANECSETFPPAVRNHQNEHSLPYTGTYEVKLNKENPLIAHVTSYSDSRKVYTSDLRAGKDFFTADLFPAVVISFVAIYPQPVLRA
jgi:hypothetical protein